MPIFDERKTGFEAKFAHDNEMKFRATARRNKLFGLWVAELLGKTGAEAEAYADDVVAADFHVPGDDDIIAKVVTDLDGRVSIDDLHAKLRELGALAQSQIAGEAG